MSEIALFGVLYVVVLCAGVCIALGGVCHVGDNSPQIRGVSAYELHLRSSNLNYFSPTIRVRFGIARETYAYYCFVDTCDKHVLSLILPMSIPIEKVCIMIFGYANKLVTNCNEARTNEGESHGKD